MASSSCSSSVLNWEYDVFLNFRGEDTRKTFISHLYKALVHNSVNAFIDAEELRKGNNLSQLLTAISKSRFSVVVFSQNYGYSTWCLKELVQILDCMDTHKQIVVPVFYEVDPSHVRKLQGGSFEEALSKHEHDPNANMEEVQSWRSALIRASNLSGWDSRNYQDDAKLIELIVEDMFKKLINISSCETNGLVGMDSRLQKMDSLLCLGVDDVRFVGIWGMPGIGKTTIARAMYDKVNHHFEGRCFLENVKGRFPTIDAGEAPLDMQAEILSSITNMKVGSLEILRNGFQKMMERVGKKKVLLVLDNVENSAQIEALIGLQPSFGDGSRIIITTRDKQSLSRVGEIYEPELLNDDDSLELFMQYAFSSKQPTEKYNDLSSHFIKYAQGLPLALKVLGVFLDNKNVLVWKDELKKIRRNPHMGIQKVLRTSFDGLDRLQKEIFLDIACFFKQMKKDYATRIMEGCDFHPHTGIEVLVDRALVSISSDGKLEMHDLLEEMGWEIVCQESIKEPGRRSRLCRYEDVYHVLTQNTATEAVESIIVRGPLSNNVVELDTAFVKMTKLRLLRVHSLYLPTIKYNDQKHCKDLKFLSEKLSCLFWSNCPLKSLSCNFNMENLVDLDLQNGRVEHLWKGIKPLRRLKIINLKGSRLLKEIPDLTDAKNLEKLILHGCTSLSKIHPSISALEKLVLLDLSWCNKLKAISSINCMKSLENLNLSFCSKIQKFPEISEVMEKLSELNLQGTAIRTLPCSINNLTGLVTLNLEYCIELKILPSNIVQLKSLQSLNLSGCSKLEAFTKNLENMEGLRKLRLDESSIRELCPSISSLENLESLSLEQCTKLHRLPSSIHMRSLRTLNLSGCSNLETFPDIPEVMENLLELYLDGTAIEKLPLSITNFTGLITLNLKGCKKLGILPSSIHMRSLQTLNISGCSNLKTFPEILEVMENLSELHLDWTMIKQDSTISKNPAQLKDSGNLNKFPQFSGIAITEFPSSIYNLTGLVTLTLRYSESFKSLTSRICQLKSLTYLSLSGCTKLEAFPEILENMEQLASLDLDETSVRELPPSIERLQGLVSLNLKNCKTLASLPDSICNLLTLEWLNLTGCSKISKLPEDLWYLKRLDVNGAGIRKYNNHGPTSPRPKRRFFRTLGELAQFRSSESFSDLVDSSCEEKEAAVSVGGSLSDLEEEEEEEQRTLGDLVDSSCEEKEAVSFWESLFDLEESSYEEEEEEEEEEERRFFRILGDLVDSSCEEKEAVGLGENLSDLEESSYEEEEEEEEERFFRTLGELAEEEEEEQRTLRELAEKRRFFRTSGELAQFQRSASLSDLVDSSYEENEVVGFGESLSDLEESSYEEEEEERRFFRILGDLVDSSCEEKEAVGLGESLSDLEESSYEEEEEEEERFFKTLGELAEEEEEQRFFRALGELAQFQRSASLSDLVDSSYEENEVVGFGESLNDLEEEEEEEEEEEAITVVAAFFIFIFHAEKEKTITVVAALFIFIFHYLFYIFFRKL